MHTIQYRELGYAQFLNRYSADMRVAKGNADEMYRYDKRRRSFNDETLEGQAAIVGDYYGLRNSTNPQAQTDRAELRRRLTGTGIYGF